MPQVVTAILSKHNFILLGLRGQAKTRLLRALVDLLDPEIPYVAGCEIHDDPLRPLCAQCRATRRRRRRRAADRVAAARRSLRREARDAGRDDRGHDWGRRSDQGGALRTAARRRADDALWAGPAGESRHLRRQRVAGPGEQGAGRSVQHPSGRGRADQRVSGPPASRYRPRVQRQPRRLHGARQDHHAPQGPHRIGDPHPLPAHAARGAGDHVARGVDRPDGYDRYRDARAADRDSGVRA